MTADDGAILWVPTWAVKRWGKIVAFAFDKWEAENARNACGGDAQVIRVKVVELTE